MPNQKELNSKYLSNLSVTSNDPDIIRRDLSGNMVVVAGNGTIYIEPVTWVYDNNSINKIIDTRFSYYKFPPRLIIDDADVPEDTTLDDIRISFSARYKAEPQLIPTIQMLLPQYKAAEGYNTVSINYGWNQLIDQAEFNAIRANNNYDPVVWRNVDLPYESGMTRLILPPEGEFSSKARSSIYFQAQQVAFDELRNGYSLGRYKFKFGTGYLTPESLIEGHFRKIKFTEILEGFPQVQPGCFVINKDIIDSKKSFEFKIQVAVSHLDNAGHNTFVIRLVRNTSVSSPSEPYEVLKLVSSLDQGAAAVNDTSINPLQEIKAEIDDNLYWIGKFKTQIKEFRGYIDARRQQLKKKKDEKANKWYNKPLFNINLFNVPPVTAETTYIFDNLYDEDIGQWQGSIDQMELAIPEYEAKNAELAIAYEEINSTISIDPNNPEDILNAQYSFLWPGKTYFTLNYVLDADDIKLNDIYSVEMLACDPVGIAHELIEENTYWDIRELDMESETIKPTSTIYYKGTTIEVDSDVFDVKPGAKGPTVLTESDLNEFANTYGNQSIEANQTSGTTVIVPGGGTKVLPSSKKFNETPSDTKQSAKDF